MNSLSSELIPVEIKQFHGVAREIDFDIFLQLSEGNFVHVFSKTSGIDYQRLAKYKTKGISHLYIKKNEQDHFSKFISNSGMKILENSNLSSETKLAHLLNYTEQNMAEIFAQNEVNEETADSSKKLVKNYIDLLSSHPQSFATLLKLASHGDYLYFHSLAVTIFSLLIAKTSQEFDDKTLEIIGLGAFLHDIGYTQLPKDLTNKADSLNEEEWNLVQSHPRIGLNMLIKADQKIPEEVRFIVYQHHEQADRNGYPNSLAEAAIYYPVRLVAVADAFSALISQRPYRPAFSPEKAIEILKKEYHHYDPEFVKIAASLFLKPKFLKKPA